MDVLFYLSPFLISFFLAVTCIFLLRIVLFNGNVIDSRKGERHIHKNGTLRFGGVAIIISFLVTLFLNEYLVLTSAWWGIIIVSLLILMIGLWDDIREISWKSQLMAQLLAGSIAFFFGIRLLSVTNPFGGGIFFDSGWLLGLSFLLTIVWFLVVMNAINWADGVDGLCGGVSFIGFATIFFLSLRPEVNQPPVAIFSLALAGSSLGFLVFNVHPAKIFAGTSGSWFLGFTLASLALFSGTKVATAVSVLALPLLDAVWVISDRIRSGVSVFSPDQRHLHYRLRNLGWSPHAITWFFYSITIATAVIASHVDAQGKMIILSFLTVSITIFFFWIRRKAMSETLE